MEILIHHTRLNLEHKELSRHPVEALILPTNNYLWFSTGISDDLKRRGGEEMENEAVTLGPIPVGEAILSKAGRLKHSQFLIHAAAWGQDLMTNEKLVKSALNAALELAKAKGVKSAAVPLAGFSVGGFPLVRALEIGFYVIVEHCLGSTSLEKITLVAANAAELEILSRMFRSARAADPPKNEDNL